MTVNDDELDLLLTLLETRRDPSVAELDGVGHALAFLLGDRFDAVHGSADHLGSADAAIHIADKAYPNWVVTLHGRANDRDGHWRCTLRETDAFDKDAVIGAGRSPVLAQAILAAVMRLAMQARA
ncbi:hypothetical protein [Tropicibacter oceani]|uniref:Uncharacterized protein n=1 Tax=Tropicibacter oceani TaxID=3058420 RepID=A0ABY8QN07_9RHOB|nr:hypothetical protein [Tropicibacter oceani]WGW06015.1 hypothetical protein QF118_19395 [Tropicibacter oceani]